MSGKSSAAIMPVNSINFMRIDYAIVAALTLSAMGRMRTLAQIASRQSGV